MSGITDEDILRLFNEGWDAARAGKSEKANPYYPAAADGEFAGAKRRLWFDGWRAAHNDPVSGDTEG